MRHARPTRKASLRRPDPRLLALALLVPSLTYGQTSPPPATQQVLVADFNNDGIPDALVTSSTSPSAFLALGSTTLGTFTSSSFITYSVACGSAATVSSVIGDFNGDTFPDIAFNCQGPNQEPIGGVLLGKGDGTFNAAQLLSGAFGSILLAGDFNHDGKLDLVTVGALTSSSTPTGILFFAGNNDGTFAAAVASPFAGATAYPTAIAVDVNGDGTPDIAAGNFAPGADPYSVDVYGSNGNGTFGAASGPTGSVTYSPSSTTAVGSSPDSTDTTIQVGNFFGAGLNDLAVVDTGSAAPGLFLLQNTSTSSAYSFATATKTAVPGLVSAQAASFTGSGTTDLLVSTGTALSVLDNNGQGTFGTNFPALTVTATPTTFTAADANFDGYADIYQLVPAGNASTLNVNLLSGSATATSMPVTLTPGTQPISAVWAGNQNFNGATASGTVVVEGAVTAAATTTTLTSALNPAPLGTPVPLTAVVTPAAISTLLPSGTVTFFDGTNRLGAATLDLTGTATYSATTLASGTHALSAVYTGDANFLGSTSGVVSEQVTVAPPNVVLTGPPSSPPGQQPTLNFQLVNPYPTPLNGTFSLTFASSVSGRADDPAVQFASGGRTFTFTIPANSTATPQVLFQDGTVAGTITITLGLTTNGTDVTPPNLAPVVITVPATAPTLSSVTAAAATSGNTVTVVVEGLSNTLEATTATFHFHAAKGDTLSDPDITVSVPTAFSTWFGSTNSAQFGSLFSYTQQFVLSGSPSSISSVDVTLTNSVGTSNMVTGTLASGTTQ